MYIDDIDDDEEEGLISPRNQNSSLCNKLMAQFSYYFGNILLTLDVVYILFLIILYHDLAFKLLREAISGYKSQPIREDYAANCDFTWSNIESQFDIFVAIYFGVSVFLAFGIRNRLFCYINAIIWELMYFFYAWFKIFNFQYGRECWFDTIVFDILISNALGIEVGLFILKYILKKVCEMYPEWDMSFKSVFCCCKYKFRLKSIIVIFNVLFLWSSFEIFSFAFYEYTFWLTSTHPLSAFRFILVAFTCIPAYAQLYKYRIRDIKCLCLSIDSIQNSYWIIIVWIIIGLEFGLTLRHYMQE